jgi:iron uptake system component EfeO
VNACGEGWTSTHAGVQRITVHNTDFRSGEVQLINPRTGAVYADVEPIGPSTFVPVRVSLSAGSYAWRCLMEDEPAITGATVHITGAAHGTTPGVVPVSQADLIPATRAYEKYVRGQIPRLITLTDTLRDDIVSGDLAKAKQDWLPAHLQYERLGAAYDAFGDLDGAINGLPSGLPGGVHDSKWTGFHRVEYGLWHGQSKTALKPYAEFLATDVRALRHQFATAELDPLQISIRAHEISENALQFELTGQTNFGSNSNLATVRANLEGTAEVLRILHGLLAPRFKALPQVQRALDGAEHDIDTHADHERIDADVSELCEQLAPIASILEPRRTS